MGQHHTWRHKSRHQQICSRCGQVRRWNGTRWLYRKLGELVRERQACEGGRSDSDRYPELRALVDAWQSHQAGSSTALAEWRHR